MQRQVCYNGCACKQRFLDRTKRMFETPLRNEPLKVGGTWAACLRSVALPAPARGPLQPLLNSLENFPGSLWHGQHQHEVLFACLSPLASRPVARLGLRDERDSVAEGLELPAGVHSQMLLAMKGAILPVHNQERFSCGRSPETLSIGGVSRDTLSVGYLRAFAICQMASVR